MVPINQTLLSPGPLLDARGALVEAGYATSLVRRYDRAAIRACGLRIKEWDYYCIIGGDTVLALTIAEGRTVFWSRSRQEIWRKGETSGNVQRVVSITADCDADALVVEVVKDGPACHTGAESCFFNEVYVSPELKQFSWQGLYNLIKGRKDTPTEGSYTTYLFEKGKEKILKKVGEECTEVIIAGEKEDKEETVYEISDLAYHVLVLMVSAGITVEDVTRELEKRHVIDHKVKQERMQ